MIEAPTIDCSLIIEWLTKQQSVRKTEKWRSSSLSLTRNEFREIYLQVKVPHVALKFRLENISVHKKFVSEGKATIICHAHPAILYLSNVPASQLLLFLKTIFIKMTSSKNSPKISLREQLLSNKDKIVQEISPINNKDMKRVKNIPCANIHITPLKRKKPIENNKIQINKKQCLEIFLRENLTDEQRCVILAVTVGNNIFFTGSAGTGKSFLLQHIIAALPPDRTVVTATTGAAACHIAGTTLHAFAGIGSGEASLKRCVQLAMRPQILSNWKRCRYLIIDEISMVDGNYFEKVEQVARTVRGVDKPFGGIQLIVCGDFLQLPPVLPRSTPQTMKFLFQFPVWKTCKFKVFQLMKVYRQTDPKFVDLLNNIRVGNVTKEITERLMRTANQVITKEDIIPTKLCSHNQEAAATNTYELCKLEGEEKRYEAEDSNPLSSRLLDEQTPVDSVLVLKVGAQVMLLKNINVVKGLVNGARGVVTKFSKHGFPVIRFISGLEFTVQKDKWVVKSVSGTVHTRKQVPLKLAWAFSIHKSQGLTLDCVEISLSKVFEAGQAYVALSRAKNLQSLRIIDFNPKQVWADPEVLKFYRRELTMEA